MSAFGFLKRTEHNTLGFQHATLIYHELQVLTVCPEIWLDI